jgi:hypothetical protein
VDRHCGGPRPAYLGLTTGEAATNREPRRAVSATAVFVLSFASVFAGLGAVAGLIGSLRRLQQVVQRVGRVVVALMGLALLGLDPGVGSPAWAARQSMVDAGIAREDAITRWQAANDRMDQSQTRPTIFVPNFFVIGRKPESPKRCAEIPSRDSLSQLGACRGPELRFGKARRRSSNISSARSGYPIFRCDGPIELTSNVPPGPDLPFVPRGLQNQLP